MTPIAPSPRAAMGYFAHHGRSFHFASRFMAPADRARVASVYAYCRFTDNIVDESGNASAAAIQAELDRWLEASRAAYDGTTTGLVTIDRAMHDMRDHGVPFRYAADLIAGMRMDLALPVFDGFAELRTYTYRVAGTVGLWMTELFGIHDDDILQRAAALGNAMQLTNIIRDVGDDLSRGRLYLPASLMRSYGLTVDELMVMRFGRLRVSPSYRAAMEAMMATADASYRLAFDAIPLLPSGFRQSVAVAAEVYRGIHDEVRRAEYDTLTARAATSLGRKIVLAARGLARLRAATRRVECGVPHPWFGPLMT